MYGYSVKHSNHCKEHNSFRSRPSPPAFSALLISRSYCPRGGIYLTTRGLSADEINHKQSAVHRKGEIPLPGILKQHERRDWLIQQYVYCHYCL